MPFVYEQENRINRSEVSNTQKNAVKHGKRFQQGEDKYKQNHNVCLYDSPAHKGRQNI